MNLSSYSHLVKEWHPTKNGDLTPNDFTHGTRKKVWWLCPKKHSYFSNVINRTTNNAGCPYCSGKKVGDDNSLAALFPDIAKEWHPVKNVELKPNEVTYGSKKKVWWLCNKKHSYYASIQHRTTNKAGCPYCFGKMATKDNNLLALYPNIAKEWHPTKNQELLAKNALPKSNKKVWWLCPKGHNYDATIASRTHMQTGCPYCSGKRVSKDNNL